MRRVTALVAGAVMTTLVLSGCQGASSSSPTADPTAAVTITIGDFPLESQTADVQLELDRIAAFEKENPNITIKTDTFLFNPDTFSAALAGGTLPTVYYVPFTEPQGLIRAGKVANVTDALKTVGIYDDLNKDILDKMSDADGNVYGIPYTGYSVGLNYNRTLFEQAGLDPDKPPTTFEELRAAAKTITEKTGVPGFGSMASGSGGGWTTTALTYAFGGTVENADGTASALGDGATESAMQLIADLRNDGSMTDYLGTDFSSFGTDFAAERFAMYVGCPCWYGNTVNSKGLAPDAWGSAGMPTSEAASATLTGGSLEVVNVDATPEQILAAVKWVKFFRLDPLLNEDDAVAAAKASAADDQPVGVPSLSIFATDKTDEIATWIEPYVNIPVQNFDPWIASSKTQELIAEPPVKAQDVYKILDVLMQSVISDPQQDIGALVADYSDQIDTLLSR